MEEQLRVPELRFRGFNEEWISKKISEIFNVTRGYVLASSKTSPRKTDLYPYPVYSSQTQRDGLMGFYHEYLFETAITWTTDGANAGTVNYRSGKFYSTNVNGVLLSDKGYANKCIAESLNLVAWKYVSHVGNPKLMNNVMSDIVINVPATLREQNKISEFLSNIDLLITNSQKKYNKLQNIKKALLEKMFPKNGENVPEIRFKGFTDDWEQQVLSNICSMHARIGWQNLRTSEFLDSGDYYLITGTDFNDGEVDLSKCHFVERERYVQDSKIQITNGNILVTKDGTLGKVALVEGLDKPATLNAGVFNVSIRNNNIYNKYLYQYLRAPFLMKYVKEHATGGTIKHLNQNILVNFPVLFPRFEEQKKIGDLFFRLDKLLRLQKTKYEKLVNIKSALLEKMFV
jgi:type I restriction enzyme S subunit